MYKNPLLSVADVIFSSALPSKSGYTISAPLKVLSVILSVPLYTIAEQFCSPNALPPVNSTFSSSAYPSETVTAQDLELSPFVVVFVRQPFLTVSFAVFPTLITLLLESALKVKRLRSTVNVPEPALRAAFEPV